MKILCFEIKFVGFSRVAKKDDREWKALAKGGDAIGAIKVHRMLFGVGLKESRDAVWKYLGRAA